YVPVWANGTSRPPWIGYRCTFYMFGTSCNRINDSIGSISTEGGSLMAGILIVDDAQFMRVTLANIIKKGQHKVVGEAENGEIAVKRFRELDPDLVIMDITMPVMNGIDAIAEIKKLDKDANIIVCSALGQQKVVVKAIELGAKDFIVKPFDENRVLETINHVLEKASHT